MNRSTIGRFSFSRSKYTLSRRGKKLNVFEDPKFITVLPKDVPERIWAQILEKEENDLVIFDIREEIVDSALAIIYMRYMERQNVSFTVHCAVKAWMKIIDWYFYRHDPGEDVSAAPECFIPKREASWLPDDPPTPSPRDTFCRQRLEVMEDETRESLPECFSSSSLEYPKIEEIPRECWFPGKVNIVIEGDERVSSEVDGSRDYGSANTAYEDNMAAESEVLQKVTDYGSEKTLKGDSPHDSVEKKASSRMRRRSTVGSAIAGGGAGGSGDVSAKTSRTRRPPQQPCSSALTRSRGSLPPLSSESRSRLSIISDCRLRNLRLDTQFEVSSEQMDLSPTEEAKRK
ncbi:uncharacterized protein [Battus philenor]|uniref:uncharacterized protein n=1 Tax=Battus philenor TaxID=42288 RepID=UPI0035CEB7F5